MRGGWSENVPTARGAALRGWAVARRRAVVPCRAMDPGVRRDDGRESAPAAFPQPNSGSAGASLRPPSKAETVTPTSRMPSGGG